MGKIVISGKEHALQEQKEIKAGQREKDQGRRHEIPVLLPVMEGAKGQEQSHEEKYRDRQRQKIQKPREKEDTDLTCKDQGRKKIYGNPGFPVGKGQITEGRKGEEQYPHAQKQCVHERFLLSYTVLKI